MISKLTSKRFKIKINDIKKLSTTFFDYAIPEFLKKENPQDPANVNQNWKMAKSTPTPVPIPTIKSTSTTQQTPTNVKPVHFSNHLNYHSF